MRDKIKFSNIFRSIWQTHTGHGDWDARSSTERNFHGGNALAQQQKSGSLTNRFLTMWSVADESYAHEKNQQNERFDGRSLNFLLTKVAFALISNWCWNAFPILMAHWGKIHAILVWHTIDAVAAIAWDASAFVAIGWCFQQALSIETTIVLNITWRRQADALLNAIADISFRAQAIRHTLDVVPLTDGIFGTIGSVTETARYAAAKNVQNFISKSATMANLKSYKSDMSRSNPSWQTQTPSSHKEFCVQSSFCKHSGAKWHCLPSPS